MLTLSFIFADADGAGTSPTPSLVSALRATQGLERWQAAAGPVPCPSLWPE